MNKLVAIFLILAASTSFGQLVTSNSSPSSLVQNVLLGPGVTVSNITYTGSAGAIGSFTASGTNLGISSGIVITTGTISPGGNGPQGPNNSSNSGIDLHGFGLPQLSNLIGGTATHDAAVLDFDFVPYADTVRFKYVFGSEEYPEFVGSSFNDVFGFFISGPGISGTQNIAKLSNGTVVSINNINNGNSSPAPGVPATGASNPQYFVPNGNGSQSPYNGSTAFIQYDGFTKVLEAVSKVQCGQTYHLRIAIADAGDGIYDSGIFLEANSLTAKIPVAITYNMSFDAFGDGKTMAEGCVNTTVNLTRANTQGALSIPLTVTGTATSGLDYTASIPSVVTFAPGQSVATFNFSALTDALTEGVETLTLTFAVPDPCGGNNPTILNLQINDIQPVAVTINPQTVICAGDVVTLIANPSGGVGPYQYAWSTGATTSSIDVSPPTSQNYTVSITDNCLNQTATGIGTVTVPIYQPLDAQMTNDITEICPYITHTLSATPSGGAGGYTYDWKDNNGLSLGNDSLIEVTPSTSSSYSVTIKDFCGNVITRTVNYTITSPPLVLTMTPTQIICPFDTVQISVSATGGYGQYFYNWVHSSETTPQVTVAPGVTTVYTVEVSDECQTFIVSGNTTVTVIQPNADFIISSHTLFEDLPITFQNLTTGGVTYVWEFGDGQTSTLVSPNNTYDVPGTYYITLIATNEIGCKDTVVKPITIQEEYYIYVPNTFTPDGNRSNNTFEAKTVNISELTIYIFNRWGEVTFTSEDVYFSWDATYNDLPVPDGTYTYKIKYKTRSGIEDVITGHVNVLR